MIIILRKTPHQLVPRAWKQASTPEETLELLAREAAYRLKKATRTTEAKAIAAQDNWEQYVQWVITANFGTDLPMMVTADGSWFWADKLP